VFPWPCARDFHSFIRGAGGGQKLCLIDRSMDRSQTPPFSAQSISPFPGCHPQTGQKRAAGLLLFPLR
jgi:hypothetical protein